LAAVLNADGAAVEERVEEFASVVELCNCLERRVSGPRASRVLEDGARAPCIRPIRRQRDDRRILHLIGAVAAAANDAGIEDHVAAASDLKLIRQRDSGELARRLRGDEHEVRRLLAVHGRHWRRGRDLEG